MVITSLVWFDLCLYILSLGLDMLKFYRSTLAPCKLIIAVGPISFTMLLLCRTGLKGVIFINFSTCFLLKLSLLRFLLASFIKLSTCL